VKSIAGSTVCHERTSSTKRLHAVRARLPLENA
jgi:hypothetical protein